MQFRNNAIILCKIGAADFFPRKIGADCLFFFWKIGAAGFFRRQLGVADSFPGLKTRIPFAGGGSGNRFPTESNDEAARYVNNILLYSEASKHCFSKVSVHIVHILCNSWDCKCLEVQRNV